MSSTKPDSLPVPSQYRGPTGPLHHRCPVCAIVDPKLLLCTGCRAVRYCGREHQAADRAEHKAVCNKIRRQRVKLDKEDHRVRHATPDFMTPANAFETGVGHFWGLINTRDYMRARYALVKELIIVNTLDGVSESIQHLRDMLRLCRSDNMGLRSFMPFLMLRLDLDQECYDFIKWWATCDPDGTYDWGDTSLPYLSIHGADIFEDPTEVNTLDPAHLAALILLKMKILVDIRNLKITRKVIGQRVPPELLIQIELHAIRSPLSIPLQKLSTSDLWEEESNLLNHLQMLGSSMEDVNPYYIYNLFNPEEALSSTPEIYSKGSWEEMALTMQYSYAAFWETEGVFDLLKDARLCAEQLLDDSEVENAMRCLKSRGEQQTREVVVEDISISRLWQYMTEAVDNASYLGPWADRPSERIMRELLEEEAKEEAEEQAVEAFRKLMSQAEALQRAERSDADDEFWTSEDGGILEGDVDINEIIRRSR